MILIILDFSFNVQYQSINYVHLAHIMLAFFFLWFQKFKHEEPPPTSTTPFTVSAGNP